MAVRAVSSPPPARSTAQPARRWVWLTPPDALLGRVRWVLVLFMLLTLLVTVLLLGVVQPSNQQIRTVALVACGGLAAWWVWGYRRGGFLWAGDVVEGVALLIVSLGVGDPLAPVFLLYFGLAYRALFGTLPQLIVRTLIYLAAHLGAVVLAGASSSAPLLSATVLTQAPGFALTVGFMRVLYHVLGSHEQLVARERHLLATAEWQAQELTLLDRIQGAMARELDLAVVLRTIVTLTADTFGYPLVSLYLRVDATLHLQHQVGYTSVVPDVPMPQGIVGRVVCSGQAVLLADVSTDPAFIAAMPGIASEVCVPLRDAEMVVGVLNVESLTGRRLGEADVRVLTAVAAHASSALERARLHAAVRQHAFHDALTGLPNRALFADRFTQALARAERHTGQVALLFLDLDGFKQVNDTLGHVAGDAVLVAVAARLHGCARANDTVARWGGDEFAVVLVDVPNVEGVITLAERMLAAVNAPLVIAEQVVAVGTSIGIVLATAADAPDMVLRRADQAMYQAKQAGTGGYVVDGTSVQAGGRDHTTTT